MSQPATAETTSPDARTTASATDPTSPVVTPEIVSVRFAATIAFRGNINKIVGAYVEPKTKEVHCIAAGRAIGQAVSVVEAMKTHCPEFARAKLEIETATATRRTATHVVDASGKLQPDRELTAEEEVPVGAVVVTRNVPVLKVRVIKPADLIDKEIPVPEIPIAPRGPSGRGSTTSTASEGVRPAGAAAAGGGGGGGRRRRSGNRSNRASRSGNGPQQAQPGAGAPQGAAPAAGGPVAGGVPPAVKAVDAPLPVPPSQA